MKRSMSLLALAAATTLTLTACSGGGGDDDKSSSGVDLVNGGKLTMCSDIPYEPFEYVKDNKNVGFDIDLADKLAKKLGVELDVITTPFEGIESGTSLQTNKCDIALSGMSVTDERKTKMDFTHHYLKDNLALMAAKSSGLKTIDDVKNKKVGVQRATTGEKYAKDHDISPVQFEDAGQLTNAMSSGKIDAAIANVSTIFAATQADDKLALVQDYDTKEVIGAGVKKGNTKLVDEFNSMLDDMLKDGSYDKLVDEWFKSVADSARIKAADLKSDS